MNLALYYVRKRRKSPASCDPAHAELKDEDKGEGGGVQRLDEAWWSKKKKDGEETPAAPTGKVIGFWLLPEESDYLKLKILDRYTVSAEEFGTVDTVVEPGFDPNHPWPVWPVVIHRKMLSAHFRWLLDLVGKSRDEKPGLYDPDGPGFEQTATNIISQLFYRGWRYFAVVGATAYYGGRNGAKDPLFLKLVDELVSGETRRPASVSVSLKGVDTIVFVNAAGETVERMAVSDLPRRREPAPEEDPMKAMPPNDALRHLLAGENPSMALRFLLMRVNSAADFQALNFELLSKVLEPKFFSANIEKAMAVRLVNPAVARKKAAALVSGFFLLCEENGVAMPNAAAYPEWVREFMGESLSESALLIESGYLELWNLTRVNGEYKYGGMKKIQGRWVYDPTVPGRTQNGKRFVTVIPPKPEVDADGKIVLKFRYQSKPARNTTGMSQVGYIKFDDHKGFMRTASRHISKALAKRDVHVHCSCPDFKYRWHWVLAQHNSAPQPVGPGDRPPDKTNPNKLVAMCKHLTACSPFILFRPEQLDKDIRSTLKKVRGAPTAPAPAKPGMRGKAPPVVKDGANVTAGNGDEPVDGEAPPDTEGK